MLTFKNGHDANRTMCVWCYFVAHRSGPTVVRALSLRKLSARVGGGDRVFFWCAMHVCRVER